MKKLRVLSEYISQAGRYPAGDILNLEDDAADFLLRDAPGCFEVVTDEPVDEGDDTRPIELVNPSDLNVDEAVEYAKSLPAVELARFLDLERAGKNRIGVLKEFLALEDKMQREVMTK